MLLFFKRRKQFDIYFPIVVSVLVQMKRLLTHVVVHSFLCYYFIEYLHKKTPIIFIYLYLCLRLLRLWQEITTWSVGGAAFVYVLVALLH